MISKQNKNMINNKMKKNKMINSLILAIDATNANAIQSLGNDTIAKYAMIMIYANNVIYLITIHINLFSSRKIIR